MHEPENILNAISSMDDEMKTPCYIYDSDKVVSQYSLLSELLGTPLLLSVKSQHNIDLMARLSHLLKGGVEVASLQELSDAVRSFGSLPKYLNTPMLTKRLLAAGLSARAKFILDNREQIELYLGAKHRAKDNRVMLRFNISGKRRKRVISNHFGMDEKTLFSSIEHCVNNDLNVVGIHMFSGSSTFFDTGFENLEIASALLDRLEKDFSIQLDLLNLGGGFPGNFQENKEFDWRSYQQSVQKLQSRVINLLHESGRGIFEQCGYFAARVVHTKTLNDDFIAICDGGIAQNFLLCQTEKVMKHYQKPLLLNVGEPTIPGEEKTIKYVGSSCNAEDIIGIGHSSEGVPKSGDICLFQNCGAYNSSYTLPLFLGLGKANEYVI